MNMFYIIMVKHDNLNINKTKYKKYIKLYII